MDDPVKFFEDIKEHAAKKAQEADDPQWATVYMLANIVDGLRYFAEKMNTK